MAEMAIPEFLQNYDEDDIHKELLDLIPDSYDKSEGQHFYNFTRPTAHVVAKLRGFDLPEAIKLIWPKFSTGEYLDFHAELRNMQRKAAQNAIGYITISGKEGTVIPAGYTVSTEARNDIASKDYVTTEACTIGIDGTVTVAAMASVAGKDGNTAANTIVVNTSSFDDVTGITNENAFTGGIDEEDDEALYARIRDYDQTQGDSNVGNPADYKRWAESIPGTGTAKVIRATDTSGLITIILTDGNGEPATEDLCEDVYNYIMSPNDENARLAPCCAQLRVIPPTTSIISVKATVKLTAGTLKSITDTFAIKLKEYFSEALGNREILYHRVCNVLGDISGVYDIISLTLNDGTKNVPLDEGVYPIIESSNIQLTLAE